MKRDGAERERPRTAQSFTVPKAEIAADYDLSLNRYREVVHEAAEHRPPAEIIADRHDFRAAPSAQAQSIRQAATLIEQRSAHSTYMVVHRRA